MRTPVLILLLAAAAAVLGWFVFAGQPEPAVPTDLGAGPATPAPPPERAEPLPPVPPAALTAEVVGAQAWDSELDAEDAPLLQADPRIARVRTVRGEGDEEWVPTGVKVLEVLARELGPGVPIRFRDAAALADFRSRVWPQPFPALFPLSMLLESCREVGFRVAPRSDGIYIVRLP